MQVRLADDLLNLSDSFPDRTPLGHRSPSNFLSQACFDANALHPSRFGSNLPLKMTYLPCRRRDSILFRKRVNSSGPTPYS